MNKKILAAVLAVSAAMSLGTGVLADDTIKVLVNDKEVAFAEIAPFIENDHTLVPMREIFEALGAQVSWDGETKTIVSYDSVSDVSITMQIGSNKMFVGEKEVILETPAKIVESSTVVPVRAVAEGMNSVVDWDQATQTVIVKKDLDKKEDTEIVNPYTSYNTFDELNAAINEGEVKYAVADFNDSKFTVKALRYLAETQMTEVVYDYKDNEITADVKVRTAPGDTDISGIFGGTKVEEFNVDNSLVELYTYDKTVYATWAVEENDVIMSYSVVVNDYNGDSSYEFVKGIVSLVDTTYPRG